MTTLLRHNFCS